MKAFISYSSVDRDVARRVAEQIRVRGWQVWIDEVGLSPGNELARSLAEVLQQVDIFVLVLTANSRRSNWMRYELDRIMSRLVDGDVKIVPLLFDNVDLPPLLQGVVYGDCRSDAGLRRALNTVFASSGLNVPMTASELADRLNNRTTPQYCVRMIPEAYFGSNGRLGPDEREYVCVGDYFENCGRSLRQIQSNLLRGKLDSPGRPNDRWLAVVFEVGEQYRREYDLMPATWKAVFRIITDKRRLGCATPSEQDLKDIGPRARDYYSHDGNRWYNSVRGLVTDKFLNDRFGIMDMSFKGDGSCFGGGQVFFVRNVELGKLGYTVQNMGIPDDGNILA